MWASGLVAMLACAAAAGEDRVVGAFFMSWGIYPDRSFHVTNIPAAQITHIFHAFARPMYDATSNAAWLAVGDSWGDTEMPYPDDAPNQPLKGSFNQLNKLKQRWPHVRTLVSAGGWTWSADFSDIAASSNSRAAFAESCVSFVTNYGFDGIDIDWEYPVEGGDTGVEHRPQDADNLVLLVQALRARLSAQGALDGRRYLLTVDTSADPLSLTNRFRLAAMAASLDWINVMAYDLAGPWDAKTGHLAPLYANPAAPNTNLCVHAAVRACLAAGVPADKIVVGVPFYGRGFKSVATNNCGLFQTHAGACDEGSWPYGAGEFDFKDLRDGVCGHAWINRNGFVRRWDEWAQAPYLFNPTSRLFVTYDDEASLALKARYVVSNDLAGIMFWSVDADTADAALERTIQRVFHPFRMRVAAEPAAPQGLELSWYGLTGQTYTVEFAPALTQGWAACATLVDTSNVPAGDISGQNRRITLVDTNLPVRGTGFHRVRAAHQE